MKSLTRSRVRTQRNSFLAGLLMGRFSSGECLIQKRLIC
jgi:hypothetical protein